MSNKLIADSFYNYFDKDREVILSHDDNRVLLEYFNDETIESYSRKIIVKELTKEQYLVYNSIKGVYNPYLETVLDTCKIDGGYYAFNDFIPRPLNARLDYSRLNNTLSLSLKDFKENFKKLNPVRLFSYSKKEMENANERFLSEEAALQLTFHICEGLESIHNINLIHGDIAPQNILFTDKPKWIRHVTKLNDTLAFMPRVIDFGATKKESSEEQAVKTTTTATENFVPPEIVTNKEKTFSYDIYSIGCVLYYMMFGISTTKTTPDIIKENVTKRTYQIITKCNDIDPGRRYQTLSDLETDILKALGY